MNLRPINRVMKIMQGDILNLPSATTWGQILLTDQECLTVSQADMSCAFYLFRLQKEWMKFLGFNYKVKGDLIGRSKSTTFVPCCRVLPMGWSSSVGEMISRELVLKVESTSTELRKQLVVPPWFVDTALRKGPREFWQVYLDNFMSADVSTGPSDGSGLALHQAATAQWKAGGVLSASDKDVLEVTKAIELGVSIDSEQGLLGGGAERFQSLLAATIMLLGEDLPKVKWVQVVLGRWVFILQYRRPGMAVLSNSWDYVAEGGRTHKNWKTVQHELSALICLAPLLQTDLRATFSKVVTCTDASHYGGAVAVATSLNTEGQGVTQMLQSEEMQPKDIDILVISAFNGIGGAFRCYDVIGLRPAGLIATEWDRAAQRVNRKAWPRTIEIGDINSVTQNTVWEWSNMFPRVSHVHLIGGFPCVHLSSARAGRLNLEGEGSRLFWKLKELIRWTEQAFHQVAVVDFLIENVFSMDVDARNQISAG